MDVAFRSLSQGISVPWLADRLLFIDSEFQVVFLATINLKKNHENKKKKNETELEMKKSGCQIKISEEIITNSMDQAGIRSQRQG